jgi:hypothetical protein
MIQRFLVTYVLRQFFKNLVMQEIDRINLDEKENKRRHPEYYDGRRDTLDRVYAKLLPKQFINHFG